MKIEKLAIEKLITDPANARKHNERNLQTIVGSLARFGQQKPIVVDKANVVRAGNGTLEAARSLGWTHLDCVRTPLDGSEATAYSIADNRSAELAEWDDDILAATLESLQADDEALLAVAGFSEEELQALMESAGVFDAEESGVPSLSDGDREPFQQMTFTLHDTQVEIIKRAMEAAKKLGPFNGLNANSNGNALTRIAEAYCG